LIFVTGLLFQSLSSLGKVSYGEPLEFAGADFMLAGCPSYQATSFIAHDSRNNYWLFLYPLAVFHPGCFLGFDISWVVKLRMGVRPG